jgi:hypothetical protein
MLQHVNVFLFWAAVFVLIGSVFGVCQVVVGGLARQVVLINMVWKVIFSSMVIAVLAMAGKEFMIKALHAPGFVLSAYDLLVGFVGFVLTAYIMDALQELLWILRFIIILIGVLFGVVFWVFGFLLEKMFGFFKVLGKRTTKYLWEKFVKPLWKQLFP